MNSFTIKIRCGTGSGIGRIFGLAANAAPNSRFVIIIIFVIRQIKRALYMDDCDRNSRRL
ncbi:hypothetical protein DERP_007806 [Dermatophagoides pteronyssinus]|uniref:Uncharacterized protein n=1 Tax=Dermatophagoides pteronyssinus TaxID=6956 RepID=A0ABQ8ISM5_DERPT|nr:hypothetical protein DERP_007806 [Dermatophagoides pteronyssinus]